MNKVEDSYRRWTGTQPHNQVGLQNGRSPLGLKLVVSDDG